MSALNRSHMDRLVDATAVNFLRALHDASASSLKTNAHAVCTAFATGQFTDDVLADAAVTMYSVFPPAHVVLAAQALDRGETAVEEGLEDLRAFLSNSQPLPGARSAACIHNLRMKLFDVL